MHARTCLSADAISWRLGRDTLATGGRGCDERFDGDMRFVRSRLVGVVERKEKVGAGDDGRPHDIALQSSI